MKKLYGKIIIKSILRLETGLHIGAGGDFSAIGAVDTTVIRDSITKKPMIPGSSVKGKMRYLLSRVKYDDTSLNLTTIEQENVEIKRLFGSSKPEIILSRLQFRDILLSEESAKKLQRADLDLPYTEIKYENTIDRATCIANPRQLERVPAGSCFDFQLVYNIEDLNELEDDIQNVAKSMQLLQDDYLGGHGTRGYGRIKFDDIDIEFKSYNDINVDKEYIKEVLKSVV